MKKFIFMLMVAVATVFASCNKSNEVEDVVSKVELRFTTNLKLDLETDDSGVNAPRRASQDAQSSSDNIIDKLTIIDMRDGVPVDSANYLKKEAGYTSPTITTTYGSHVFLFLGRAAGKNTYSFDGDSLLVFDKPNDLVFANVPLRVTPSTGMQSVTLSRVTARITFKILDAIPSNVKTIKLINRYSYRKWSIINNCATQPDEFETSADISSLVGRTGLTVNMYTLTPDADLFYTNMYVGFYDADGNLLPGSGHELQGVNVKRNCITTISGNYFASGFGVAVAMNTDFDSPINYTLADLETE